MKIQMMLGIFGANAMEIPRMGSAVYSPPAVPAAPEVAAPVQPVAVAPDTTEQYITLPPLDSPPASSNFLFHNKLPKSGSTTMKYIISTLQKANNFHMDYQAPCINKLTCATDLTDGLGASTKLAEHVAEQRAAHPGKFVLLKHQYWHNFTMQGMEQPTYINVVRDPITRFSSMYYFQRYGFASMGSADRKGVQRHSWKGTEEDIAQTLDMCVENLADECTEPLQILVRYFCGTGPECSMKSTTMNKFGAINDWNKVSAAAQIARTHIIKQYYAIGLMEEFEETLALFETVLPQFFKGAQAAYNSQFVRAKRDSSKTAHTDGFNNQTRQWLETGPLRYEMDLYNLIKSIFNQRLNFFGISKDTLSTYDPK